MRWPRWSIRRSMLGVLILAVGLGFALPAYTIISDREWHVHTDFVMSPDSRNLYQNGEFVQARFWPRYWLYLRGKPWRKQALCPRDEGRPWRACEFEHPEIVVGRSGVFSFVDTSLSPRQRAEYERLKATDPMTRAFKMTGTPIP
jgi:hypothetical protein